MFETFCVGFCQLVVLFCTWAVPGLQYVICCYPACPYTEGKHVLFALSASVPPSALGRLQVYSHRLWILLHVQHHRLPHWLWNPVPAGELQLQDGSHAWYDFGKRLDQLKYVAKTCFLINVCVITFDFYAISNRNLHSLHSWAVQRLCWPSFRWAHTLYCISMNCLCDSFALNHSSVHQHRHETILTSI